MYHAHFYTVNAPPHSLLQRMEGAAAKGDFPRPTDQNQNPVCTTLATATALRVGRELDTLTR